MTHPLDDELVEEFTDGTGNQRWRVTGWASCNCGKIYHVVTSDENRLLAVSHARMNQISMCRGCEAQFSIDRDSCMNSSNEGSCDLPFAHTGRCESRWAADKEALADGYRRAHLAAKKQEEILRAGPVLVSSRYHTTLNVWRAIREFSPELHGQGCVLGVQFGTELYAQMNAKHIYDWELTDELLIQAENRFGDVRLTVGGEPTELVLSIIQDD